jgi:hypothetical protein
LYPTLHILKKSFDSEPRSLFLEAYIDSRLSRKLKVGKRIGGSRMELRTELARLCDELNRARVKYVVIGGCAVILHGYFRTTHDIDLLVEPSPENIRQLKKALHDFCASDEVFEIRDDDVIRYAVVRFAPESKEIAIDLIGKIGDITFDRVHTDIEELTIEGTIIPLCGISSLIETKKGIRPKDKEDLLFLQGKKDYLEKQKKNR